MYEEQVIFYSEAEKVYGTLALPDQLTDRTPLPAVVLAHGYGSFRDELTGFVELANKLSNQGLVSLRFDFRGCGQSGELGRIRPFSEWVTDTEAAISFLQSHKNVDGQRIGLVGMSVGGGTVCWVGGIDPRVRCVVTLAPVADGEWWLRHLWTTKGGEKEWREFLERLQEDRLLRATRGRSKKVAMGEVLAYAPEDAKMMEEMISRYPAFAREIYLSSPDSLLQFKPLYFAHFISPRPIRFIHSKDDTSVPIRHSQELYARAGEVKDFQVIHGSPHCFWLSNQSEKVQELTLEWILKYL